MKISQNSKRKFIEREREKKERERRSEFGHVKGMASPKKERERKREREREKGTEKLEKDQPFSGNVRVSLDFLDKKDR